MQTIRETLAQLDAAGNLRRLPHDSEDSPVVDLSSNDYLGLADDIALREEFLAGLNVRNFMPTSSASRLLSARQESYERLETRLSQLYGRAALLFNSGYHANTGLVSALGGKGTLFVADKLVHASIIDGLTLSGSRFERFRHNDYGHLHRIIEKNGKDYSRIVILSESVFSMDGDMCDITALAEAKRLHPNTLLYIDEAHAVGVLGPQGLGCVAESGMAEDVDIVVGTFGKALASFGAFAILSPEMREFMVNRARSLIFSTSIPPMVADWSLFMLEHALKMDSEREHLHALATKLQAFTHAPSSLKINGKASASHIQPLITGDARRAVELSKELLERGFKVLPIRTPTVPPGTERLRFSLSASMPISALDDLVCSGINI